MMVGMLVFQNGPYFRMTISWPSLLIWIKRYFIWFYMYFHYCIVWLCSLFMFSSLPTQDSKEDPQRDKQISALKACCFRKTQRRPPGGYSGVGSRCPYQVGTTRDEWISTPPGEAFWHLRSNGRNIQISFCNEKQLSDRVSTAKEGLVSVKEVFSSSKIAAGVESKDDASKVSDIDDLDGNMTSTLAWDEAVDSAAWWNEWSSWLPAQTGPFGQLWKTIPSGKLT